MMSQPLWILIAVQIAMGAFDMLYHHELTERLAWRPSQRKELVLHGARNLLYAVLFTTLGWIVVQGAWAWVLLALLGAEVVITLTDFVEEDLSRKLPATERVTHALLALNYGALLILLVPPLVTRGWQPTSATGAFYGYWSWFAAVCAIGVAVFGVRDLMASVRARRLVLPPAAELVRTLSAPRTILVTGATGFIGRRLTQALTDGGHQCIILTRDVAKAVGLRPPFGLVTSLDQIPPDTRIDVIVNLAGEPIGEGLWTKVRRRRIVESRVEMTAGIAHLIARLEHRPEVVVNGSAIGWYGLRGDEQLTEADDGAPCFSRDVCIAWEKEAKKIEATGARLVLLRIGLVMGIEGGVLSRLLVPFEFGAGGPIGSGRQWMSWIERDDLVRLIAHAIATPTLEGPLNATAPIPVTNKVFGQELGRALRRPSFLSLPGTPLHYLLGDFADELLLGGQRVLPQKALASGFQFRHANLGSAFRAILGGTEPMRAETISVHVTVQK